MPNMPTPHHESKITIQSLQKTYEAIAAEFDVTRYKPWPQTVEFIDKLPEGGVILDLGSGNGRNSLYLASIRREFKIIGLDFSLKMLRIAKNKIKQSNYEKSVEFILAEVSKLPIATSSLDGALYVATLHHLPSAELRLQSLIELERCLKPGCEAFIGVWDFEQERFEKELATQLKEPPKEGEFGDVLVPWTGKRGTTYQRFYHLFYRDELEKLIDKTPLKIIDMFRACDNYHAIVQKIGG